MLDAPTIAICLTVAGCTWRLARIIRDVETTLTGKLASHAIDDMSLFNEHGLRLQKLETHAFGFTQNVPKGSAADYFPPNIP